MPPLIPELLTGMYVIWFIHECNIEKHFDTCKIKVNFISLITLGCSN